MSASLARSISRWALAALIAGVAAPAVAQIKPPEPEAPAGPAAVPKGEQFDDWRRQCDPAQDGRPEQCFIFQKLVAKGSGQNIMAIQIAYVGEQRIPAAIVMVPLGIFLPAGITLNVPGTDPVRIPVEVCTREGCRGATKLSEAVLTALRKAAQAKITLVNALPRREVNLPVSLKGFTKGMASLKK